MLENLEKRALLLEQLAAEADEDNEFVEASALQRRAASLRWLISQMATGLLKSNPPSPLSPATFTNRIKVCK